MCSMAEQHSRRDRAAGKHPCIVWFRDDLRLTNHAPLSAAARHGLVLPVFVIEDVPRTRAPGAAALWWLKGSLAELRKAIDSAGGNLLLLRGTPQTVIPELAAAIHAVGVFCHRAYDASGRAQLADLERALPQETPLHSLVADTLAEPGTVMTGAGEPYRVFTPFWRSLRARLLDAAAPDVAATDAAPVSVAWYTEKLPGTAPASAELDAIIVPAEKFGWTEGLAQRWQPGEAAAIATLERFAADGIATYEEDRNLPAVAGTSMLSPHLRFGEIAIRTAWNSIAALREHSAVAPAQCEAWLRELGWREFCRHLLFHFPQMTTSNYRAEFDAFDWREDEAALRAWQYGRTGYPLVDAGMRELWATGWMHNRVRMVVASFLTKHLRIHWRRGELWFWDTLVDADYANNPANWQWVAGTGVDAAPYFRVFNPTLQAQRFDSDGEYIRRWVPEIAQLPDKLLHQPWQAGAIDLAAAGVKLGDDYPEPIVEHASAREDALAAHAALRSQAK